VLASSWSTLILSNSCTRLLYCKPAGCMHNIRLPRTQSCSNYLVVCVSSVTRVCFHLAYRAPPALCGQWCTQPINRGVLTSSCCATQDMTRLSYLHEPGVLWNIKNRYIYDDIYTYTGSILIAVNPFAPLPHLYGPHMMDQYRGVDLGDLSPHVYAIADAAYRQMRKEFRGQSILVSSCWDQHTRQVVSPANTASGARRTQRRAVHCRQLTAPLGQHCAAAAGAQPRHFPSRRRGLAAAKPLAGAGLGCQHVCGLSNLVRVGCFAAVVTKVTFAVCRSVPSRAVLCCADPAGER
jgi:hypothetical protein